MQSLDILEMLKKTLLVQIKPCYIIRAQLKRKLIFN